MMQPMFLLQIVDRDGVVLTFPGGERVEADLKAALTSAILRKGVGFWRTERHVEADIRAAIDEVVFALKSQTLPFVK